MADRALAQAGTALRDIELFAVSNGPGSFTGIRVGLAAAQGWAKAFARPVRAVNLLEAMAEQAHPEADWVVPILDARRGEFFVGTFRRVPDAGDHQPAFEGAGPGQLVHPERLETMLDALSRGGQCRTFSAGTIVCVTRAHDLKARSLSASLSPNMTGIDVPGSLLEAIARVALRAHAAGEALSPEGLDACYIRRSDAEMNWRPQVTKAGS
jgi:tRNA threonylcarbamoyladenosine biosynthesis protein TsaB